MGNVSSRVLKDGVFKKICTISIKLSYFPKDCNVAKLKPLYKKGTKQIFKILG